MTRLARYTRDLMTNVTTRVLVRISREPARQAPEHRLVPEGIPGPATGASEASVGRVTEPGRHPYQGRQQQNALREEPRAPLFPPRETVRILKRNASARPASTAHQCSGFFGKRLSLRGHFIGPITPLLLVKGASVSLFLQDRSQIWSPVAIRTGHRPAYPNITADPFLWLSDLRQRHLDPDSTVPLAILAKDLTLLTERCSRQSQGTIHGPVLLGGDVQLAHPLNHDPQVEALGGTGSLDLGRVDQFCSQGRSLERFASLTSGLETTAIVRECAPGRPSVELPGPFARRDTGLLHSRNLTCGIGMQPTKQPRQKSERVSLVGRREEFELVREYNCRFHIESITEPRSESKA